MIEALNYAFMQKALMGGAAIAIACGLVGPFLVLRKLSLLGHGLAHLSFGGVALGLLLGINPLISALVAVVGGSLFLNRLISRYLHGDAAIALIQSFGVGLGIIIIGSVKGFGVDLFSYLIGSILVLDELDLWLSGALLVATATFIIIFFRPLMLFSFSQDFAELRIRHAKLLDAAFILLVAFTVVISMRAVGILLISALLVIPTLIALQVTSSFRNMLLASAAFSLLATVAGIIASFYLNVPPSGAIVMLLFGTYAAIAGIRKVVRSMLLRSILSLRM